MVEKKAHAILNPFRPRPVGVCGVGGAGGVSPPSPLPSPLLPHSGQYSAWIASKSSASSKRFTLLAHVEQSHTASIPSLVGFHSPAASHRTGKRLLQQSQEIRFVFALASMSFSMTGSVSHATRRVKRFLLGTFTWEYRASDGLPGGGGPTYLEGRGDVCSFPRRIPTCYACGRSFLEPPSFCSSPLSASSSSPSRDGSGPRTQRKEPPPPASWLEANDGGLNLLLERGTADRGEGHRGGHGLVGGWRVWCREDARRATPVLYHRPTRLEIIERATVGPHEVPVSQGRRQILPFDPSVRLSVRVVFFLGARRRVDAPAIPPRLDDDDLDRIEIAGVRFPGRAPHFHDGVGRGADTPRPTRYGLLPMRSFGDEARAGEAETHISRKPRGVVFVRCLHEVVNATGRVEVNIVLVERPRVPVVAGEAEFRIHDLVVHDMARNLAGIHVRHVAQDRVRGHPRAEVNERPGRVGRRRDDAPDGGRKADVVAARGLRV